VKFAAEIATGYQANRAAGVAPVLALLKAALASELVRFIIAGGVNTIASYMVYGLLLFLTHYLIANSAAYVSGILLSYYLHSAFVFHQPLAWRKLLQFPAVYVVQYILGNSLLFVLVEFAGLPPIFAPVVVIMATIPATFVMSRFIIRHGGIGYAKSA